MKLNLKRPLVFLDLETTGVDVASDRIVEMALVKVMPDGSVQTKPDAKNGEGRFLINPETKIPLESSLIHGIYDEDVKDAPTFKDVAPKLFKYLYDCDLGGFNSNRFDVPLLAEEFLRAGIDFSVEDRNLVDVQVIFHMMEQRTLSAGYKFYCNKTLEGAHEALPDTMATYEIFLAQLERYKETTFTDKQGKESTPIVNDMEAIAEFCKRTNNADLMGRLVYDEDGDVAINFGKYKGKKVKDKIQNDLGYYGCMMKSNFPEQKSRHFAQQHWFPI
ncbi:MAG: 3'-5' exonuclease [Flavobacteriales bacterium]|nr:3'-5' exonuclease [Flavobacteriales bacterium]